MALAKLRRLVLDVLKPHEPSIIVLSQQISALKGVDGADITIVGVDRKVENARITLEGENINYDNVVKIIHDNGGSVKRINKASSGTIIVHHPHSLLRE
ncbi:MAG: DUF211 domain-containing protein [Candidatus Woesearchaeota archaeon]